MSSTRIHVPVRQYTQGLGDTKPSSIDTPFGSYKYDSSMAQMPGGIFHFVSNTKYVPTLHGLTADTIKGMKEVGVCTASSSMHNRPFLNSPFTHQIELINTGHSVLTQGNRFTVQLPTGQDIEAQLEVARNTQCDPNVNPAIMGGLMAIRLVKSAGDAIDELMDLIKEDSEFHAFALLSPYTPESALSMLTLIANGGEYSKIPHAMRRIAHDAITGAYCPANVQALGQQAQTTSYLRNILYHSSIIFANVQGFASGQVTRASKGHTENSIFPGDRFYATITTTRWAL